VEEPLSPWYKTKPTPKPVEKSEEVMLRAMRLLLQGSIYASWDIDKPGEKDKIRREFRVSQQKIYPDHPHLVEQVLQEMLPEDLPVLNLSRHENSPYAFKHLEYSLGLLRVHPQQDTWK
jgi:hypothetical protein